MSHQGEGADRGAQARANLVAALRECGELADAVESFTGPDLLDGRDHLAHHRSGLRAPALAPTGAPAGLRGRAGHATDVAGVQLYLSRALDGAVQLDAPGTVDEIEEDELSHVTARHHAAGEPAFRFRCGTVFERVSLRADSGDLVAVGKALRRGHGARV